MALPLIAAGVAIGAAVLHESNKNHYRNLELNRKKADYSNISHSTIGKSPSDAYDHGTFVEPKFGSVVCCEIFNCVDHTGIWIDDEIIIELSDNGLVKSVSSERFLEGRSGAHMFVACDNLHNPIIVENAAQRALDNVFSYREYDLINNNCHRFVNYCLTGKNSDITLFSALNDSLSLQSNQRIFWDRVKTSC